jgi:hypothetical protein
MAQTASLPVRYTCDTFVLEVVLVVVGHERLDSRLV